MLPIPVSGNVCGNLWRIIMHNCAYREDAATSTSTGIMKYGDRAH